MDLTRSEKGSSAKKAELSLTPMIDVVFLLLIFFMVGMKFKELDRKLETDLPKAGEPPEKQDEMPPSEIWVIIKNAGTARNPSPKVIIDQRPFTDWDSVYNTLARLSKGPGAKQDPVIVAPDGNALQGWVMKILDHLNQLKFRNINFKQ